MQTKMTLLAAALAAAALGGAAAADGLTGKELQTQQEAANAQKGGKRRISWRGDVGYRFTNRRFRTPLGNADFDSHELGGNLTGYYGNWFLTGGFNHSIATSDLDGGRAFGFDTETWDANGQLGYQFFLNRNLTLAPFIGFGWTNTNLDENGFDSDYGYGGLNFGALLKWAPGYSSHKAFPRWTFFAGFQYFPDLYASGDIHDVGGSGDTAWLATAGVEHNLSKKTFVNATFGYGETRIDGPFFVASKVRDYRAGVNFGVRF